MEQTYDLIPLSACRLMLFAGHNRLEQHAFTAPGQKPDGDGWDPCPRVSLNGSGHELGYLWTRKLAREGDCLVVAVTREAWDDTQPVHVPVDIVA